MKERLAELVEQLGVRLIQLAGRVRAAASVQEALEVFTAAEGECEEVFDEIDELLPRMGAETVADGQQPRVE